MTIASILREKGNAVTTVTGDLTIHDVVSLLHEHRGRPVGPHVGEGGGADLTVAHQPGHQHDGDHGHQAGDVHLVERVHPVDGRDPLLAPRPSEVADDGSGFSEGHRHGLRR